MSISSPQLFSNFHKQSAIVDQYKKALTEAQDTSNFARAIRDDINQAMHSGQAFNWENDPKRKMLEKLYSLEEFQEFDKIYSFTNPQMALALIQKIEQYHSDCMHKLELKKNVYAEKKSALQQSHNELLNIINELGRSISTFLR